MIEIKKQKYLELLDSYKNEQEIQCFLEKNTEFIPRAFSQHHGIHNDTVFRKLCFGNSYKSDFVLLSKSSDDWHVILIEIEKPKSKFFKDSSNEFHSDFIKAQQQITNWKAWFSNQAHQSHFIESLSSFRGSFHKNPSKIKYVLVMGRKKETEANENRLALIRAIEKDDFEIMTFDSLIEGKHGDLYLCVKKNEYIEIHSETPILEGLLHGYPGIFSMPSECLRIKPKLKNTLIQELQSFIAKEKSLKNEWFLESKQNLLDNISNISTFT